MPTVSATPTRKRYGMLALIFFSVVVNYMDRANMGVASTALRQELGFSMVEMGLIFSAFAWTYSFLQVPGGIMVDVFRTRVLYSVILFLWSVATIVQGFANSVLTLVGCRMAIGTFEAPSYPCNNKIVTSWFPDRERATAIAIYTSGQFLGLAFLSYFLTAILEGYGWRGLFYITGALGIGWAAVMWIFYRDPTDHPTVSPAEIEYIREGGGHPDGAKKMCGPPVPRFSWRDLGEAFKHRKLWGVYLGQYCMGSLFWFFLAWFPTYLKEAKGLTGLSSGFYGSLPYLGAFCGVLLSGFTSDWLLKRGHSMSFARKTPMLLGLGLSTTVIGANFTDNVPLIITFMTIAFFGNGLACIAWVFISSMAPIRLIGLVGGVFNFIGNLSGATFPLLIGWLAKDGSFTTALFVVGGVSALGFCSYLFLVGEVKRIEETTRPVCS